MNLLLPALLRLFLLFSLCFGASVTAQEFLDPLVAFKPTLRALDGQTVEVRYEIAKGYYLYRDHTTVKLEGKDAEKMLNLVDALEEHDDVQNVYSNYEVDEEE